MLCESPKALNFIYGILILFFPSDHFFPRLNHEIMLLGFTAIQVPHVTEVGLHWKKTKRKYHWNKNT